MQNGAYAKLTANSHSSPVIINRLLSCSPSCLTLHLIESSAVPHQGGGVQPKPGDSLQLPKEPQSCYHGDHSTAMHDGGCLLPSCLWHITLAFREVEVRNRYASLQREIDGHLFMTVCEGTPSSSSSSSWSGSARLYHSETPHSQSQAATQKAVRE